MYCYSCVLSTDWCVLHRFLCPYLFSLQTDFNFIIMMYRSQTSVFFTDLCVIIRFYSLQICVLLFMCVMKRFKCSYSILFFIDSCVCTRATSSLIRVFKASETDVFSQIRVLSFVWGTDIFWPSSQIQVI